MFLKEVETLTSFGYPASGLWERGEEPHLSPCFGGPCAYGSYLVLENTGGASGRFCEWILGYRPKSKWLFLLLLQSILVFVPSRE